MVTLIARAAGLIGKQVYKELMKKGGPQAVYRKLKELAQDGNKRAQALEKKLDEAQGIKDKTPGRKNYEDGITVGKDRVKADKNTQQAKGAVKGAGGVVAAGGTAYALDKMVGGKEAVASQDGKTTKVQVGGGREENPADYRKYDKKSESAGKFREAFAKAKKEGKKTFVWDGRKYSTETK